MQTQRVRRIDGTSPGSRSLLVLLLQGEPRRTQMRPGGRPIRLDMSRKRS